MSRVVVLIDDVRRFVDGRSCLRLRTSADAVAGLQALAEQGAAIDELWLDFDLGAGTTVRPVLSLLELLAAEGRPVTVHKAYVITSSSAGAHEIRQALRRLDYDVERLYSLRGLLRAHPSEESVLGAAGVVPPRQL